VGGMTDNPTRAGSRRRGGSLVAAMLLVALAAVGCGAAERASEDLVSGGSGDDPGVSVTSKRPTIAKLDPDLLSAVRAAALDARKDGVRIVITSGWRSRAHQQRLFDEAVSRYGSVQEALRYVATPDTSAHVTGDAVDVGPTDAAEWLGEHGSDYGLCQIFANEIWHFELATTPGGQCPTMYPDGSYRR
jgi:D-alanyl-D-alanine carboxypeptidase